MRGKVHPALPSYLVFYRDQRTALVPVLPAPTLGPTCDCRATPPALPWIETPSVGAITLVGAVPRAAVAAFVDTGPASECGFKSHASATLDCRHIVQRHGLPPPPPPRYSASGPYEEPSRMMAIGAVPVRGAMPDRGRDASAWVADNRAARRGPGWQPAHTVETGLRRMVRWSELYRGSYVA